MRAPSVSGSGRARAQAGRAALHAPAPRPAWPTGRERRIKRWEHEAVVDAVQRRLDAEPKAMRVRRQAVEHPFGTLEAWTGSTHFLTRAEAGRRRDEPPRLGPQPGAGNHRPRRRDAGRRPPGLRKAAVGRAIAARRARLGSRRVQATTFSHRLGGERTLRARRLWTGQVQPCGSNRFLAACYSWRGSPAVLRRAMKSRNARIAGGSCRRLG
jgi:hypothetical protein